MSKSSKRRQCPPAGREITSAECGEGRQSRFACPADCAFNPFAPRNYSEYLELERSFDGAMIERLKRDAPDSARLEKSSPEPLAPDDTFGICSVLAWHWFFRTDAQGRTLVDRWEAEDFSGLKNDHRVLMSYRRKSRIALLEVRRLVGTEQMEVVDLLESNPIPFILHDRALASTAVRFTTWISWVHETPHYHRIIGTVGNLVHVLTMEPRQVLLELCRHLGGPEEPATLRRWLAENLNRVMEASSATEQARHYEMIQRLEADVINADYLLKVPFADFCQRLEGQDDFVSVPLQEAERREGYAACWVVLQRPSPSGPRGNTDGGADIRLGAIFLGSAGCRIRAIGGAGFAKLQTLFETVAGLAAQFVSKTSEDLRPRLDPDATLPDMKLVPPALLINPTKLEFTQNAVRSSDPRGLSAEKKHDIMRAMDRAFLDEGVPALEGKTPREAAADPRLRSVLILLMKERIRICDERNLLNDENEDINWMVLELGLNEILFDPPPRREPPAQTERAHEHTSAEDIDEEWMGDHQILEMDPKLPPAPALPDRPLTVDEIDQRIQECVESNSSFAVVSKRLLDAGCTLVGDVWYASEGYLTKEAMELMVPVLLQAWHAIIPTGYRGANIDMFLLQAAIRRGHQEIFSPSNLDEPANIQIKNWMNSGPQPNLSGVLFAFVGNLIDADPVKFAAAKAERIRMFVVIRAVVEVLDAANR